MKSPFAPKPWLRAQRGPKIPGSPSNMSTQLPTFIRAPAGQHPVCVLRCSDTNTLPQAHHYDNHDLALTIPRALWHRLNMTAGRRFMMIIYHQDCYFSKGLNRNTSGMKMLNILN